MALNTTYQYEQPKIPSSWLNDNEKRRFYNRLIDILDDVYLKYGRIDENMLSASVRKTLLEAGGVVTEVRDATGEGTSLTQKLNEITFQVDTVDELADATKAEADETANIVSQVLEVTADGVYVRNTSTTSKVQITSDAINLILAEKIVATFAQTYLRLKGMQISVPEGIGGLTISAYTEATT